MTDDVHVCRICRRPLSRHSLYDTDGSPVAVEWRHEVLDLVRGVDHDPDPVRLADTVGGEVVQVCDFCAAPHPLWRYPCRSFTIGLDPDVGHVSDGAWMACATCHRLIERGDWPRVVRRALAALPPDVRSEVRPLIEATQRGFRLHRDGPAVFVG